ncbi:hypothetical protein HDU85_000210 [Gaertneriomyces sp. JEL0708]|nr:hypothetical protein HDU85_000210 [Gaertneriomyces sp. JEL0708]
MFQSRSRSPKKPAPNSRSSTVSTLRPSNALALDEDTNTNGEPNTLPKLVTETQNEISASWSFMTGVDFNPVPHALSLLDESSLGRDYGSFCDMYQKLEAAMDVIVEEYHDQFNTAIQTFSSVVENVTDSQSRVRDMRTRLESSREWLQCKRFDLLHLWVKSIQYKEMTRILDTLDEMQNAPTRIESLIASKHYLTAVRLLVSAIRTVEEGECAEIGAVEGVRVKLNEIRNSLTDVLIEELHNHTYLKSPFSTYRLETVDQTFLRRSNTGDENPFSDAKQVPDVVQQKLDYLQALAGESKEITEDLDTNPETDSYHYTLCILEALHLLGPKPLRKAIDVLRERLGVELFYVVERTVQESDVTVRVKKRERRRGRSTGNSGNGGNSGVNGAAAGGGGAGVPRVELVEEKPESVVLVEFLWALFRRLECVVRGQWFLVRVLKSFEEDVWFATQNELKTLLYEYVNTDDPALTEPVIILSLNDLLKDKRRSRLRSTAKPLFRLPTTTDSDSITELYRTINPTSIEPEVIAAVPRETRLSTHNQHHDDTNAITNLHPDGEDMHMDTDADTDPTSVTTPLSILDSYATNTVVAGHRLLIPPDAGNILVVFEPTMKWVRYMESVLEVRFMNLHNFLHEFHLNVYIPMVEARVVGYYATHVGGLTGGGGGLGSSAPPPPATVGAVCQIVESVVRCLKFLPTHHEEVVRILEGVVRNYVERCWKRYEGLVEGGTGGDGAWVGIVSGVWVRDREVEALLAKLCAVCEKKESESEMGKVERERISQKETVLEMKLKGDRSFHRSELILDVEILKGLAVLHRGMEWFAKWLSSLLSSSPTADDSSNNTPMGLFGGYTTSEESLNEFTRLSVSSPTSSLPSLTGSNSGSGEDIPALDPKLRAKFESLVREFERLAKRCLWVLRVEVRTHAFWYLELALREGTYHLDSPTSEPDSYITSLTLLLSHTYSCLSPLLSPAKLRFVYTGLETLIATLFVRNVKWMKRVNRFGVAKCVRNVRAVRQALRNMDVKSGGAQSENRGVMAPTTTTTTTTSSSVVNVGSATARPTAAPQDALLAVETFFELMNLGVEGFLKHFSKPPPTTTTSGGDPTLASTAATLVPPVRSSSFPVRSNAEFIGFDEYKTLLDVVWNNPEIAGPSAGGGGGEGRRGYDECLKVVREWFVKH